MPQDQPITQMLQSVARGDSQAAAQLLPLVYGELRQLAQARLARTPPGNTLQPTALVHEAYMRLVGDADPGWENRGHFFGAAAQAMRQILVDQARRKSAEKHGGGRKRLDVNDVEPVFGAPPDEILAVDEALRKLEAQDERKGRIVNLRYFAGMTVEETAEALGVSVGTIERDWRYIKRWLYAELADLGRLPK